MDATQMIDDSVLESEEEEIEEEDENNRGEPLAKLRVLKNEHIPETELPLYLGDNVLGRDPNTCTLPLLAPSVSKQHTAISVSVYRGGGRRGEVVKEALVWDMGSMNGTRKGRLKLTPHVRYALSEGDRLVVADIPCQYVSCAADKMSGGGDTRPPVSRDSGERARRSDAFRVNGGDTSTDSGKCVNGGAKAPAVVSSPGQEETRKTPARTTCLSFEQTPTQPQCTLVSESDSDSDGEKGGGRARQGKALVSDSDSHMSSPTCSTFLSPTNKIIPESEDESPITPCSSTKNRPNKHVSFSKEERDVDVGRQQLKKKRAQVIVDDSEEEEGREEEERAAPGGREAEESGQDAPVKQENNVSLSGGDGSPVSTPAVSTDAVPVFNMDSDTDVEGEEEGAESVRPVTLNTTPQADQPTKPVQFHMDSDTDVDEDDDALDKVPKSVPASNDDTLLSDSLPVAQPAGTTLDSDTDVDDDADATVSDAATKATLASLQSAHTADSAPSKDFHLDSDTDVDEEEESDCRPNNMCITIDKTPSGLDLKPGGVESASAAPHNLHLDSDTDDEVIPAPVSTKLPAVVTDIEPPTAADRGAELDILSNSDTDLEEDTPLLPPVATATNVVPASAEALSVSLSTAPVTASAALQSDSDADTDADESGVPPAGEAAAPADFRLDSDKDLEDTEAGPGEAGEGQTSGPSREKPSGLTAGSLPPLQKCSTPLERAVEEMETQAFFSPPSGPFRLALAPAMRPVVSSCSDSQEDEDFVVAETQSFVLETRDRQGNLPDDPTLDATQPFGLEPSSGDEKDGPSSRGGSFQLGLSDSSHLLPQAQALAMESTQAFVSLDGDVNLEDTQAYGTISPPDRTSKDKDSDLEATQAYRGDQEPAVCSTALEKESRVDFALEATQAYIPESHSDPEDETEEEERTNIATAETQPLDFPTTSLLAMAETQPMCAFEEEENQMKDKPPSSVHRRNPRKQNEREEGEEDGEATQLEEVAISEYLSTAETQPLVICEDEESDDEDLIPAPCKRKAKALQLEEESQSQLSAFETQPLVICEDESDDEDLIPAPCKRKAKALRLEEESQSQLSAVETQPLVICEDESDDEDLIPAPCKRKAKALQLEEESQSQLSTFETQPLVICEDEESDDEDLIPAQRKRKAKALRLEEESQSQLSAVETQPLVICEDEESDDEDLIPAQRKRKAKALRLEEESQSQLSAVETQPMHDDDDDSEEDEKVTKHPSSTRSRSQTGKLQVLIQPIATCEMDEEEEHEEEETKAGLRKTKKQPQRGKGRESEAGTSGIGSRSKRGSRVGLGQQEEHSEPPRRQTRGKSKALSTTRGRRGKIRPEEEEEESEEKEEVEQAKRGRGRKTVKHQKDDRREKERLERKQKEEEERLEMERKEQAEKDRLLKEQEEKERRVEQEKIERERKKKEEQERLQRENAEREAKLRLEQERAEREEKERLEREEKERIERERKEQEKERFERIQKEKEEQEKIERERKEKEEQDRLERERKEKEEQDRLEREKAEREEERLEREEKDRIEKERKEQEEKERLEKVQREVEEQERLERERKEREHQAKLEREEKEREERKRLERVKQEKEQLEKEAKEKLTKEEENKSKASTRGRRAARRTIAAPSTAELNPEPSISANDDIPARRTRSRSNSSNSVSSERSASSVTAQESRGRGRGQGAKKTSQPTFTNITRDRNRRRTVAGEPSAEREAAEQDMNDIPPPGVLSRSNSTNSLNSEISSCSISSQSRGKGGRGRGRGRKTEPETDSIPPVNSQSDQNSAPKATARGRKSRKAEGSSNEDGKEKADSKQPSTTRGRRRADEEDQSTQEEESATEDSLLPKRNVRGRGQKSIKCETFATPVAAAVNDGDEAKEKGKGKGRKRELEEEGAEEEESSGNKISRGKAKAQRGRRTEAAEEEEKDETKEENPVPVPAKRRGRASTAQGRKNAQESLPEVEVKEESKKMEEGIVERKARGRQSVAHKKKEEREEEGETSAPNSMDQGASAEASEVPQTPTSSASRKRAAPVGSSPVAKTPRSCSASPATVGRVRAASQAYKVLFTGLVDEAGERVVARLGSSLAKGVADMTCLVTDKVRRTVKFLCAVAKGVPIVTTHWLEKSGKAGSFLSPNAFIVKDAEQEKKFNFCLQESLKIASSQPLLQGYEIHVTKSVKPEPVHMKDIISCSGASFLPKMPSSHKAQTIVISCEEDWSLCGPALSASLPVLTAEFILTGILQQKLDFNTHTLPAPTANPQPAGGRGRGRKKT